MSLPFSRFNSFSQALGTKQHNLATDQLEIAMTSAANPPNAGNTQLSNLTQISYTGLSSRAVTTASTSLDGGVFRVFLQDLTLLATTTTSFRYIVLFNQTSVNDLLIGWYDYGSTVTLAGGEIFLVDFNAANSALTIS